MSEIFGKSSTRLATEPGNIETEVRCQFYNSTCFSSPHNAGFRENAPSIGVGGAFFYLKSSLPLRKAGAREAVNDAHRGVAAMEQTVSTPWAVLLAGAGAVAIIIVGGMWAVVSIFLRDLKRDYRIMRTQMDGVHIAINSMAVSLAELKATVSPLIHGLNEMREDIDRLRVEVEVVSGNVARIAKFLGHLAGTPPSFPSDLLPPLDR